MTTIINKTKKNDTLNFKFSYNGQIYFGWYCAETKEFKLHKEEGKNTIVTLGWAYWTDSPSCQFDDCDGECCRCPYARLDTAGWEFEDATELLQKAGLIK